jgi:hypothetical protein
MSPSAVLGHQSLDSFASIAAANAVWSLAIASRISSRAQEEAAFRRRDTLAESAADHRQVGRAVGEVMRQIECGRNLQLFIGWHFRAATSAALVGSIRALLLVVILTSALSGTATVA